MEAKVSQSLQLSTWIDSEKIVRKSSGSLRFTQRSREQQRFQVIVSSHLQPRRPVIWHRPVALKISCSSQNNPASVLESGSFPASFDEAVILKNKAEDIEPYLSGQCIYLVGMMGSGKTTIGRILSEVIGYSFFDRFEMRLIVSWSSLEIIIGDTLIEHAVGGTAVADIFKLHGESFFRDNETEILRKLSLMHRLVVSTGGGAVIRPINWKYMHKGISIWLDVPLEALARRITAVGTNSRPLLHHGSGDAYAKTFKRLCTLWEDRSKAYTNASARVSLENIAAKLGYEDVCDLTPTEIAFEALVQIESFLKK